MNEQIKEILDDLNDKCKYVEDYGYQYKRLSLEDTDLLLDYITNLQQENERLEENNQDMQEELARTWQKCDDLQQEIDKLIDDKRGMLVQLYKANDERDKVKRESEKLKERIYELIKDCNKYKIENARLEEDLKGQENLTLSYSKSEQDYKSRCEKANNQLKIIMQILKEQPNRSIKDDEWLENRLIAVANILQNGSDSQ